MSDFWFLFEIFHERDFGEEKDKAMHGLWNGQ